MKRFAWLSAGLLSVALVAGCGGPVAQPVPEKDKAPLPTEGPTGVPTPDAGGTPTGADANTLTAPPPPPPPPPGGNP